MDEIDLRLKLRRSIVLHIPNVVKRFCLVIEIIHKVDLVPNVNCIFFTTVQEQKYFINIRLTKKKIPHCLLIF